MFNTILIANRGENSQAGSSAPRARLGIRTGRGLFRSRRRRPCMSPWRTRRHLIGPRPPRATATFRSGAFSRLMLRAKSGRAGHSSGATGSCRKNADFAQACAESGDRLHRAERPPPIPRHRRQGGKPRPSWSAPASPPVPGLSRPRRRMRTAFAAEALRPGLPGCSSRRPRAGGGPRRGMRVVAEAAELAGRARLRPANEALSALSANGQLHSREISGAPASRGGAGLRRTGADAWCICSNGTARRSAATRKCSRKRRAPGAR